MSKKEKKDKKWYIICTVEFLLLHSLGSREPDIALNLSLANILLAARLLGYSSFT